MLIYITSKLMACNGVLTPPPPKKNSNPPPPPVLKFFNPPILKLPPLTGNKRHEDVKLMHKFLNKHNC